MENSAISRLKKIHDVFLLDNTSKKSLIDRVVYFSRIDKLGNEKWFH